MPAGFQIFRDNGAIQITSDYSSLALVESGSITTNVRDSRFFYLQSSYTFTRPGCVSPVMLVRPYINIGMGHVIGMSGGVGTFKIDMVGDVGQVCNYWIFDQAPTPPAHGNGLQVFRSDGSLAFDSSMQWLRVVDIVDANSLAVGSSWAFKSGHTYGVMVLNDTSRTANDGNAAPPNSWTCYLGGMKALLPNGFIFGEYADNALPVPLTAPYTNGRYLIADVTGY